jgi:pilus assembly protein CpaB
MRPKSFMLLIMALGCGLVASIGISQVIEGRGDSNAPEETVEIYVAMTDIGTGDPITAQMIKLEAWPKSKVDGLMGVITNAEELLDCRPRTTIFAGEPMLAQKISDGVTSASERIREGYRAVAVKVDSVTSIGGVLQPGDRVDVQVYLKRDASNGIHAAAVRTLLQNVKVFAINAVLDRSQEDGDQSITARTITLELTPRQSEIITLAAKVGTLQLVGRNSTDDKDEPDSPGVDISYITGAKTSSKDQSNEPSNQSSLIEQAKAAVAQAMKQSTPAVDASTQFVQPEPKPQHQMELIRGSEVAVAVFEGGKLVVVQPAGGGSAINDSDDVTSFDDARQSNTPNEEIEDVDLKEEEPGDRPE